MSFTPETFSPIGANSTDAYAVYAYKTDDTLNDLGIAGYFSVKELQLKQNDIIQAIASDGFAIFVVQADTSSAVLEISATTGGAVTSVNGQTGAVIGMEEAVNKGAVNGYAGLDGGGTVPLAQLPASVIGEMTYLGAWDASTNTPTLADGVGDNGDLYLVSVAGTQDLGSGNVAFNIGDQVVYDGTLTVWQKFGHATPTQLQSDWDETDTGNAAFIQNKPIIVQASTPTVGQQGLIWYHTTDEEWYFYDGNDWVSAHQYTIGYNNAGPLNNGSNADFGQVAMDDSHGPILPFDAKIIRMTVSRGNSNAGTLEIESDTNVIETFTLPASGQTLNLSPVTGDVIAPADLNISVGYVSGSGNLQNAIMILFLRRVAS